MKPKQVQTSSKSRVKRIGRLFYFAHTFNIYIVLYELLPCIGGFLTKTLGTKDFGSLPKGNLFLVGFGKYGRRVNLFQ